MKDLTNGGLQEALEFAKTIPTDSLIDALRHLQMAEDDYGNVETEIYNDFAPKSFEFIRREKVTGIFRGNGGIIFHGQHDRGGDGGAPTFSVSLSFDITPHWEIHT